MGSGEIGLAQVKILIIHNILYTLFCSHIAHDKLQNLSNTRVLGKVLFTLSHIRPCVGMNLRRLITGPRSRK
jgi:hypothetical protein